MRLRVAVQARRDTARILEYIARENPQAAPRLAHALELGMLRLLEFPLCGPLLPNHSDPSIRQLIVTPCRVIYRILEQELYIVGVMRCEQDLAEDEFEDR